VERIEYTRPAELQGVEVMRVDRVARRWRVFHETYTVCTVLDAEGEAEFTYRARLHRADAGDILLMEPGELHANTRITPPGSFRVLFVPPSLVEQAAAELGASASPPHWKDVNVRQPDCWRPFVDLHASLEGPATALERESRFAACLKLLLSRCTERAAPRGAAAPAHNLQRCRDYLLQHYAQPVTLDQLATVSQLSRFHLVRAFAKAFGVPPHAYQLHVRVEKAQELLDAGMLPSRVAFETGFADQSHFTHHFMQVTGVTPRRYARALEPQCLADTAA
jgi:AraC-like DNA-binding protein